jgi:hypothetical protein
MGIAPIWENYVMAQATQASLGLIPASTLAIAVEVDQLIVRLEFQLASPSEPDLDDVADIADQLSDLLGPHAVVESTVIHTDQRTVVPPSKDRGYIYLSR